MASEKSVLSSIIILIAAIGIAVRFFGTFVQLAAAFVKAFENARNLKKKKVNF
jgi:hypothetical protein